MDMNKNLRSLAEKAKGGDSEALQLLVIEIPGDSPLANLEPEEIMERLLGGEAEPRESTGLPADEDGDAGTPPDDGEGDDSGDGSALLADAVPPGMDIETFKTALRAAEKAGICTCAPEYADELSDYEA